MRISDLGNLLATRRLRSAGHGSSSRHMEKAQLESTMEEVKKSIMKEIVIARESERFANAVESLCVLQHAMPTMPQTMLISNNLSRWKSACQSRLIVSLSSPHPAIHFAKEIADRSVCRRAIDVETPSLQGLQSLRSRPSTKATDISAVHIAAFHNGQKHSPAPVNSLLIRPLSCTAFSAIRHKLCQQDHIRSSENWSNEFGSSCPCPCPPESIHRAIEGGNTAGSPAMTFTETLSPESGLSL